MSKKTENKIDKEQAQKAIEQDRKERQDKCTKDVQQVLKDTNCSVNVYMVATQQGNSFQIEFIAN